MKIMPVAAAVAMTASACEKNPGDSPLTETVPMERPVELVAENFTAYPSGLNACVDSYLSIEFESVPEPGRSGKIRILDADGNEADVIDMSDVAAALSRPQMTASTPFTTAMDAVGSEASGYYRIVYYDAVTVEGKTVRIRLHSDKLKYGERYSVEMDAGAIVADGFEGIGAGQWSFTVMPRPEQDSEVTVGSRDCDFMTVQGAINFAAYCGQNHAMTISVSEGIYGEPLYIRNKNHLTIRGAGADRTVIRFSNSEKHVNGVGRGVTSVPEIGEAVAATGGRSVILVENCDMLKFENISVENVYGDGAQAETIYFNSDDGRLTAENCRFSGEQDTIELKGWSCFRNCRVTGDVDFIWGYVKAALFDSCEICSCDGGYIVQARCKSGDRGFVFLNCELTASGGVDDGSVYLARSGGGGDFDNVTYVNCLMDEHIAPAGWHSGKTPTPAAATPDNGWKEYGSKSMTGHSIDVSGRYSGSIQLTDADCERLYKDVAAVFSSCPKGYDWAL